MSDMVWLHAIYCKCEQCVRVRGDLTAADEPEVLEENLALTSESV